MMLSTRTFEFHQRLAAVIIIVVVIVIIIIIILALHTVRR